MTIDPDYFATLHRQRRELLDMLRTTSFTRLAPHIPHQQVIPVASYSPWADDKTFQQIHAKAKTHTLVDIYRCHELWSLAQRTRAVPGALIEIGVWRGGTAAFLCAANATVRPAEKVQLFDTFSGVVKSVEGRDTRYKGGEHADTDASVVAELLASLGLNNYETHAGVFPEKTGSCLVENVRMCHIDVDTYGSAKACLEFVWPKLSPGGMLVFDDYGFWGCEGVTELLNTESPEDALLVHNLNGHGILIKLPIKSFGPAYAAHGSEPTNKREP